MSRTSVFILLIALILTAGCDRGGKPPMVGDKAPLFTVKDEQRTVSLEQYRGKVVVLNFWATWCPPCVEEMPSLKALHSKMGDRIVLLAVSTDTSKGAYDKFVREFGIQDFVVRDAEQVSNRLYGSVRLPETYIIDQQGVVQRKFVGPLDWTSTEILDYLNKLSAANTSTT